MQIRKREDADPLDGIKKYGEVEFADPVNNKYPIDTVEHVRSAWAHINVPGAAKFYNGTELGFIKSRIIEAAKRYDIGLADELIERDARLFTAGDYPDRGIEITEADLDRMVDQHCPVPIKVEHRDTPFELGTVTRLWRVGKDLFGKLAFTAPAWALVQSCGAKKLSAAVKRDKSGLAEVSIVRHPRIAGAAVFADDLVTISFDLDDGGEEMSETKAVEFSKRISDLENELRSREVDSQIEGLKRAGKVVPATEGLARVLLSATNSQVVTFSDGTEKPVAETFHAFLEAQPKVIEFSELVNGAREECEVSSEEQELLAKLGVSPESAAKYRKR